ncbi:MAG: hypothetical protein MJ177_01315 [Clostridia bacterium]|nr:hypothetical protein [Clostridia bacterium]
MKCRHCGKEIEPGFDYCESCGTVLSNEERARLKKTKPADYKFDVPSQKNETEYATDFVSGVEPAELEIFDENLLDEIAVREEEAAKEKEIEMDKSAGSEINVLENEDAQTVDNPNEEISGKAVSDGEPENTVESDEQAEKELGVEDDDFFDEFQKDYALKKMFGHPAEISQDNPRKKQKQKADEEKAAAKQKTEKEKQEKEKAASAKKKAEDKAKKEASAKKRAEDKAKKEADAKKKTDPNKKAVAQEQAQAINRTESKSGGIAAGMSCVIVAVICLCVAGYGYSDGWFDSFIHAGPAVTENKASTSEKATTEKATTEKATTEKATTEKATTEKTTTEKATTEKATTEKATTEKVTTEKVTTEKTTTEKTTTEKETTEKETTEKETTEKIVVDTTEYPGYVPPGEEAPVIGEGDKKVSLKASDYLYAAPSVDSYAVYSVYEGDTVEIKGYNSDKTWAYAALSNGYFGWIEVSLYK